MCDGHESRVADPTLGNCTEMWSGLGQLQILKERPSERRININDNFAHKSMTALLPDTHLRRNLTHYEQR
jgi:hypothetical protein